MARGMRHDTLFRALLRLFPAEFRGDFGRQMAADFEDQRVEAAARSGAAGLARVWLRTALDLLWRAPREHLDVLGRDTTHALRVLRRHPVSTATVASTLAIGIGLNTALFSVVSGILWQQLPFRDSDRLVRIFEVEKNAPDRLESLTHANYAAVRGMRGFSAIGAGGYTNRTIVSPGEPESLPGMTVTEGFFEALGITPVLGRTFTAGDHAAVAAVASPRPAGGTAPALSMIISESLWQRRFHERQDIIGQRLRLGSGMTAEIVGVIGPAIAALDQGFGREPQWWMPNTVKPALRQGQILDTIARLAPGVSTKEAAAELSVAASQLAAAFPDSNRGRSFRAVPLIDSVVKNARGQLLFLFGAVLAVLLVASANVVHLFLSNVTGRRAEFATRVALGATRAQLVRQILTQSLLLASLGGGLGLLLAGWGVPVLIALAPAGIPRLHEVRLDWPAFGFAAVASIAVAVVCAFAAAVPLTMAKPWRAMGSLRSASTVPRRRARRLLVIGEVAIALMLVVASMLMVRTLQSLASLDLGFDPRGVIATTFPRAVVPGNDVSTTLRMHEIEVSALEEIRRLPGVIAAGVGGSPMGLMMGLDGVNLPNDRREFPMVSLTPVSVGYFEALGARLLEGRFFTPADQWDAQTVAIVSESAAKRFWPAAGAIGRILILPAQLQPVQVVGIVADMSEFGLTTKGGGIFLPHVQSSYVSGSSMLIRTDRDPQALVPAIRAIVRRVNPEQPFPGVTPLQDQIDQSTAPRRFVLRLVSLFSGLGLVLAVMGIYGVVAESVAERVPEIGVRMAMGARPSDVLALFLRQGAVLAAIGLALGLAGAFLLRHQMTTMVFGVATADPVSYAAACAALALAALAACAIPAFRAARLDPVRAIREGT